MCVVGLLCLQYVVAVVRTASGSFMFLLAVGRAMYVADVCAGHWVACVVGWCLCWSLGGIDGWCLSWSLGGVDGWCLN